MNDPQFKDIDLSDIQETISKERKAYIQELKSGKSQELQEEIEKVFQSEYGSVGVRFGLIVNEEHWAWSGHQFLDPSKRCDNCDGCGYSKLQQFGPGTPCEECDATGLVSPYKERIKSLYELQEKGKDVIQEVSNIDIQRHDEDIIQTLNDKMDEVRDLIDDLCEGE